MSERFGSWVLSVVVVRNGADEERGRLLRAQPVVCGSSPLQDMAGRRIVQSRDPQSGRRRLAVAMAKSICWLELPWEQVTALRAIDAAQRSRREGRGGPVIDDPAGLQCDRAWTVGEGVFDLMQ